jgi:predicted nucleic acid-binding Zn ribbon protein
MRMARKRSNHVNPGALAVRRERGQTERDDPGAFIPESPISELMPGVMKKFGLEDRFWEQSLLREWEAIVGPQVARHTRPGRVQGAVLHVYVSHSTWLNELMRYGMKEMLANIQAKFGTQRIRSVRLALDPEAPGSRR